MIKKLLRRFGYTHESDMDENFFALELARSIGDPMEYTIEKDEEEEMFRDLAKIEHLPGYLTATLAKDMQRSFAATEVERAVIKGAFARTSYWRSKVRGVKEKDMKVDTKLL